MFKDVGFYECIDSETSDVDIDSGRSAIKI